MFVPEWEVMDGLWNDIAMGENAVFWESAAQQEREREKKFGRQAKYEKKVSDKAQRR